jgi:transposase-like protein
MNVHRFDEEQRRQWVEKRRAGALSVKELMAEAGISRATLYNWLAEFPEAPPAAEASTEPEEVLPTIATRRSASAQLQMLQEALAATDEGEAPLRQQLVRQLMRRHNLSVPQACAIAGLPVDAYQYKPRKPEADDREVYEGLYNLLEEEGSRQFEDLIALLRVQEPTWPRKQIRRIYKEARLYQKRTRTVRVGAPETTSPAGGRKLRYRPDATWILALTALPAGKLLFALDDADRAPLGAVMLPAGESEEAVLLQFLAATAETAGLPRKLRLPGIAPFNSREVLRWAMGGQVGLQTASMGKEENVALWAELDAFAGEALADGVAVEDWILG